MVELKIYIDSSNELLHTSLSNPLFEFLMVGTCFSYQNTPISISIMNVLI